MANFNYLLIIFILSAMIVQHDQGSVNCIRCSQWYSTHCAVPFRYDSNTQVLKSCTSGVCKAYSYKFTSPKKEILVRGCSEDTESFGGASFTVGNKWHCDTDLCNARDDFIFGKEEGSFGSRVMDSFSWILLPFSCTMILFTQ